MQPSEMSKESNGWSGREKSFEVDQRCQTLTARTYNDCVEQQCTTMHLHTFYTQCTIHKSRVDKINISWPVKSRCPVSHPAAEQPGTKGAGPPRPIICHKLQSQVQRGTSTDRAAYG
jgi:hypothetical protein